MRRHLCQTQFVRCCAPACTDRHRTVLHGNCKTSLRTGTDSARRTSHPPDLPPTGPPAHQLPQQGIPQPAQTARELGQGLREDFQGVGGIPNFVAVSVGWGSPGGGSHFLALRPFLHPILKPFRGRYLPPRSADVYARTRAVIDLRLTAEQF